MMPKRVHTSIKAYRTWHKMGKSHVLRMNDEGVNKHPPSRAPKRWVWKQEIDNRFSEYFKMERNQITIK